MSRTPMIECRPDGPYLVRDLQDLRDVRGQEIACSPVMALCRCGGSAKKPFCDGTHKKIGFSGAKLSDGSADKRDDYRGKRITIHDNRAICAHAGHCTDRLAAVFRYGEEPWIDPDGAEAQAIIETIRACPSGALSYSIEGVEAEPPPRGPRITVTRDGPYEVVGGISLPDQSWCQGVSIEHYSLCRCGASQNKPFCDGAHHAVGFKDG